MDNKQEIDKILTEIQADAKVQKMKQFIQHGNVCLPMSTAKVWPG